MPVKTAIADVTAAVVGMRKDDEKFFHHCGQLHVITSPVTPVLSEAVRTDVVAEQETVEVARLPEHVQKGAVASVVEKLRATDVASAVAVIEPRISEEVAVTDEQPVPHVGVPLLPVRPVLQLIAVADPPPLVRS